MQIHVTYGGAVDPSGLPDTVMGDVVPAVGEFVTVGPLARRLQVIESYFFVPFLPDAAVASLSARIVLA